MYYEIVNDNEVFIGKKRLVCPICDAHKFVVKTWLFNTTKRRFFDVLDWKDEDATNFICEQCGYVFWFALRLKNKFAVRKDEKPVEGEPFPGSEIDKII